MGMPLMYRAVGFQTSHVLRHGHVVPQHSHFPPSRPGLLDFPPQYNRPTSFPQPNDYDMSLQALHQVGLKCFLFWMILFKGRVWTRIWSSRSLPKRRIDPVSRTAKSGGLSDSYWCWCLTLIQGCKITSATTFWTWCTTTYVHCRSSHTSPKSCCMCSLISWLEATATKCRFYTISDACRSAPENFICKFAFWSIKVHRAFRARGNDIFLRKTWTFNRDKIRIHRHKIPHSRNDLGQRSNPFVWLIPICERRVARSNFHLMWYQTRWQHIRWSSIFNAAPTVHVRWAQVAIFLNLLVNVEDFHLDRKKSETSITIGISDETKCDSLSVLVT